MDNQLKRLCNDAIDRMLEVLDGKTDVEQDHKVPCRIVKRCTTDF